MDKLSIVLDHLRHDYPNFKFVASRAACWDPGSNIIKYSARPQSDLGNVASLLHETAHATLGHICFSNDSDLLRKELDAWRIAKELAKHYSVEIPQEHVENCLDTYRHWIYRRSCCPNCKSLGVQTSTSVYSCQNCKQAWHVTDSRNSRLYRSYIRNNTK